MAKYRCPVCNDPCTSEKGCFRHKPKKPLPRTGRIFSRKSSMEKEQEEHDKMWKLFQRIWKERGPWSEIDDSYLGRQINSCFFDHLLPKETFPEVKYEDWNILMVTRDQHTAKHDGFPHPKHVEAIEKAKQIYNNLFSNC